jgi:hypothetical protein
MTRIGSILLGPEVTACCTLTPDRITVGDPHTWLIRVQLDEALPRGTVMYFVFPGTQRQRSTLQDSSPRADGYYSFDATVSGIEVFHVQISAFEIIRVEATDRLSRGTTFQLSIFEDGTRRPKDMGLHPHSWRSKPFPILAKRPGSGSICQVGAPLFARIDPGPPSVMRAVRASTVNTGQVEIDARIAYFDALGNPVDQSPTDIWKMCSCGEYRLDADERRGVIHVLIPVCSCETIAIQDRLLRLETHLNPSINIGSQEDYSLYWGEIHSHSYADDGIGLPDENHTYAKGSALLDFTALTVHDHFAAEVPGVLSQYTPALKDAADRAGDYSWEAEYWPVIRAAIGVEPDDSIWEHVLKVNRKHDEPGAFAVLNGYEWTASIYDSLERATGIQTDHGHRCVYFDIDDPPLVVHRQGGSDTPEGLHEQLAEYQGHVLVIPHHPAKASSPGYATDWDRCDEGYERLVEVFSCHGNSEFPGNPYAIPGPCADPDLFVRNAIGSGQKFGFTAGTDNHEARPGQPEGGWGESPGGFIGVWAGDLTRQGVFEALHSRRCYGVSHMSRMIVDFRINGEWMGSEIAVVRGDQLSVHLRARGTARIREVHLIRNGLPFRFWHPNETEVTISLSEAFDGETASYYFTLYQEDGVMAWASPIWLVEL